MSHSAGLTAPSPSPPPPALAPAHIALPEKSAVPHAVAVNKTRALARPKRWNTVDGVLTRTLWSGEMELGEYTGDGALLRRYVHGPGVDEPLLWYEGAGLSDRRGLLANHQGSIVGVTNSSGGLLYRNTYEEYGAFGPSNGGRFSFTGQIVIPELALLHYKGDYRKFRVKGFMVRFKEISHGPAQSPYYPGRNSRPIA